MGMKFSHYFASDARTLDMAPVWSESHFAHLIDDSSLYWFQAVPGVRKCPGVDDRIGVFEEAIAHFSADVDVNNALVGV
jgi:hypothetical protein